MFNVFAPHKNRVRIVVVILLMILPLLLPIINALTGNYSITSPFSCGNNCSGGNELTGHTQAYCDANPVDCFNTIDECKDGSEPTYEYVEDISITSLNGSNFTGGDMVAIDAALDCDTDGDEVSFVYNNGSGFKAAHYTTCAVNGNAHRYYNLTLDNVSGDHTVRIVIAYSGSSGMLCGDTQSNSKWTDTDDVTFFVYVPPDNAAPVVTAPVPDASTSYEKQTGLTIQLCANVTDDIAVDTVLANVTWNSGNYSLPLSLSSGITYCGNFQNTSDLGTYNVTFVANDTSNNVNDSVITNFIIIHTTNITVHAPVHCDVLALGTIALNFTLPDDYVPDYVFYSLNGGANTTVTGGRFNASAYQTDAQGSMGENTTYYPNLSMSFTPVEDMSVNLVALSLKRNSSGTPNTTVEVRTDDSGVPSSTVLAYGNITNSTVSTTNYVLVNVSLNTTVNLTASTSYWLMLRPNSSQPDFYFWESNDDGIYDGGNYTHDSSKDLLFIVYDRYRYRTAMSGLSRGDYGLMVYANSTSLDDVSSPEVNFSIDYTLPTLNSQTYNPNTTAALDPNVVLTFTYNITDDVAVNQVILQYKKQSESSYSNIKANNSGDIYMANITPDTETVWQFRVQANDTSGNSMNSSVTSLNITYEYDWNISPDSFNTTSAFLDLNSTIGNITINNSADLPLTFDVARFTSSVSVYLNDTLNNVSVYIGGGDTVKVPVVATGMSSESEHDVSIIIDPLNSSADPDYLYINFTFISYVSGVYLDVGITQYDATVTQGQERVPLSTRITNAGNETATNIYAYWEIPSDWTAKTNLTYSKSTLTAGEQVVFTRYVTVGSSAATGNHTINVTVNCTELKNDTDSRVVTVSGSGGPGSNDPQNIIRGGGGVGGGLVVGLANIRIELEDEVEVERGSNITLTGYLNNTGGSTMHNISLELDGFSPIHYRIKPDYFDGILAGGRDKFLLTINIPEYFGSGKHNTTLKGGGVSVGLSRSFKKELIIIVVTEDKMAAFECFEKAAFKLIELEKEVVPHSKLSLKLEEAKGVFSDKEYSLANSICQDILVQGDLGITLKKKISLLQGALDDREVAELVNLMQKAYEREDFALAASRSEQVDYLLGLKEEHVEQTLSYKVGILRTHVLEIIIAGAVILLCVFLVYSSHSLSLISKRIEAHEIQKEKIKESVRSIQKKYFVDKAMAPRMYKKHMGYHRKALANLEKKKHNLHIRKLKIVGWRKSHNLEQAKQEAIKGKEEIQKKYFIHKSIDKPTHRNLTFAYDRIIEDIEKRLKLKKR